MIEAATGYIQHNSDAIFSRFFQLFSEPFFNSNLAWIIIPLIMLLVIMEIYWSSYKYEDVGWDTITANSLVLVFISMDLFRLLSNEGKLNFLSAGTYAFSATMLVLFILLFGAVMMIMNLFRLWPKFFAYIFSSVFSVNILAYIIVVLIYGQIPLDASTLIAATAFFILLNFFFFAIRRLSPSRY